ncbi:hypothetical protein [Yoonia sp. SS1-5]|uniref:Uncharacterized protein n=1 Tax=Yoonia rhodophyticola TaxID=3137370 RepID=A0AAN0MGJ0_9RHOB
MLRRTIISAFAVLVIVGVTVMGFANTEKGTAQMNVDLTLYLGGKIAVDGGVVLILPQEVPADAFVVPEDRPNIAQDRVTPTGPDQIVLGADVRSQKTIVTFQYPAGASYTYRFRTRNADVNPHNIKTDRIGVGSGTGVHPVTGETEAYDTVLTHHIDAGEWTTSQSRAARAELNMGFLAERYGCIEFAAVQVCDARVDRLEP